jgi:hypothetical protein
MAILASTTVVTSRRSLHNFSTRVYVDSTKSSEKIDFFYDKVSTSKFALGRKVRNQWDWSRSMGFMTWSIGEPRVNAILTRLGILLNHCAVMAHTMYWVSNKKSRDGTCILDYYILSFLIVNTISPCKQCAYFIFIWLETWSLSHVVQLMTFQASLESLPIIHIPEPAKFFRRSTKPKEREWSRQQPAAAARRSNRKWHVKVPFPKAFSGQKYSKSCLNLVTCCPNIVVV